jgi:hypothetical protein
MKRNAAVVEPDDPPLLLGGEAFAAAHSIVK